MSAPAYHALILRNFNCGASASVAHRLTAELWTGRYGRIRVDHNEPDGAVKGPSAVWFPGVKERIQRVQHVIPILSSQINTISSTARGGVGLVAEILYFWDREVPEDELYQKVIPVLVDCSLEDLRVAQGGFEQQQDIVVPLLKRCGPIRVTTSDLGDATAARTFVDQVARRLGIEPRASE